MKLLRLRCLRHRRRRSPTGITQMSRTELCTSNTRLKIIGYYYFLQGKLREQVKVNWKGDETRDEIEFVNRTLDEAHAWLAAAKAGCDAAERAGVRRRGIRRLHVRQGAVSRLLAGLLCVAATSAAADAAIKAREGDVNRWIEHYERERQPRQPAQAASDQPAGARQVGVTPPAQAKESKH